MNLWSFKGFLGLCDKPMINAIYKGEEKRFAAEKNLVYDSHQDARDSGHP